MIDAPARPVSSYKPTWKVIDQIDALPRAEVFAAETMLYQASPEFAETHGGPLMREFLKKLPSSLLDGKVIVDARIHRLGAGHYPAIPGYHLDWIPRKDKGANPDLSVIPEYEHAMVAFGVTSLTEFVSEPITFPDMPDTRAFEYANRYIKNQTETEWGVPVETQHMANGEVWHFTSYDWHRPTPSLDGEWRYLIRASRVAHGTIKNEIRTQAQVYIPINEASW